MSTKEIDYYGDKDNYIHLKFGDARKMYNFTAKFKKEYPDFAREYTNYWEGKQSKFKGPFSVVSYVFKHKLPVHFYYNYTDTPATDEKEIMEYLVDENSYTPDLSNKCIDCGDSIDNSKNCISCKNIRCYQCCKSR
jgi:hypothetical protein